MIRRAYDLAAVLFTAAVCLVVPAASRQSGVDVWIVTGVIFLAIAALLVWLIQRRESRA